MRFVAILAIVAVFIAAYVIWVRPYLKGLPRFSDIYAGENRLWASIKVWLDGRKTILVGIWGEVIAMAPDMLASAQVVDLKTLLHLPDEWALYINALIPVLMMIFRAKAKIGQ